MVKVYAVAVGEFDAGLEGSITDLINRLQTKIPSEVRAAEMLCRRSCDCVMTPIF